MTDQEWRELPSGTILRSGYEYYMLLWLDGHIRCPLTRWYARSNKFTKYPFTILAPSEIKLSYDTVVFGLPGW